MRFSLHKRNRISVKFLPVKVCAGIMFGCFAIYVLWFMEQQIKPAFLAIAETRAAQNASQAINRVIYEKVSEEINPESLVTIKLDHQGRVVFIQPNTVELNKLSSDTALRVQAALKNLSEEKIDIPLGQAFGHPLFAALGPRITVTVIPLGTVEMKFVDTFEQAGINQTRHQICLTATTKMRIVIPLVSKEINVNTQVPVTEYVVVGDVPSTYVQLPKLIEGAINGIGDQR